MAADYNDPVPEQAPDFGVLKHNADWANTFGVNSDPRATVNPTTRARYGRDRDAFSAAQVEENARQTHFAIQTDKTRQALYFKTQQLRAAADRAAFDMGLRQEKFDADMSLVPLKKDALAAQTRSALALESSRLAAAARESALETHKAGYLEQVATMPFDLTPEQEDEWMDSAARKFPGATKHPETMGGITSARSNIAARRTAQAKVEAATVADSRKVAAEAASPPKGTTGKPSAAPELTALKTALGAAVTKQTLADDKTITTDGNTAAAQFQPGIDRLKAAIAEKEGAPPSPATAPSAFKEGDTRIKDGKTYKRDATGTWHPQL